MKKEAAPVKKAVQPVVKDDDKDYVIKGNVSPIFGEIEEPKKEKRKPKKKWFLSNARRLFLLAHTNRLCYTGNVC